MRKDLLQLMRCPYCGSDFKIKEIYNDNEKEIMDGYICCECSKNPILDGILIVKNNSSNEYIIDCIKNGEFEKAMSFSFGEYNNDIWRATKSIENGRFGKIFKKYLLYFVNNYSGIKYKKYVDTNFFCDLGNSTFENYLKHRFSSQTFWLLYPFIRPLKTKKERVLDICCGSGHASFVISKYVNPNELICVDGSFKNLYLTKNYFSNAECIVIDANQQLPFKDNIFSSILMMDALHYIDARISLVNEFERIIDTEGILLILHVHNALVENMLAGKPVAPSIWKRLFNNDVKLLQEKAIIEDFILRDQLNLSKEYSEEELNSSNAISLVRGIDSLQFKNIWREILDIKGNLIINPIYKMKKNGDKILLERILPYPFKEVYPLTDKYLPEYCTISEKLLNGGNICISDENKTKIEELMRKFVIINVPEKFIKNQFS
jgi:ubiquinone/menaquinone biosynthesis C-methylase UbiE/DNA-directed RNA polymerase subunit RPC12/RpoP